MRAMYSFDDLRQILAGDLQRTRLTARTDREHDALRAILRDRRIDAYEGLRYRFGDSL